MNPRFFLPALLVASLAFAPTLSQAAEDTAIQTAAQPFSVVVEGSGPDVILIPGLASPRSVWSDLATKLKAHYRLHLVQIAGFAGEPVQKEAPEQVMQPVATALSRYIETAHLRKPTVIGHSIGGELALMVASETPDEVGAVIVVDALPFYPLVFNPMATRETALPHATALRQALLQETPESQRRASQQQTIASMVKTPSARPALVEAGLKSDRKTIANALYDDMTTDLRPALSKITAPVTVIYAYDPVFGVPATAIDKVYRTSYTGTAHVHFTRIDDSYHFIMIDQPEKFGRAVEAALRPSH
ncbi:alpha/beta hydrolase [Asaia siamensis]|uniref:Alpha/beta hydrolase n=1 Tax=Asaia siamensis TaxID=110479 RepID=A0ABQ1M671_9PROT|nr:alpha/beta hydrolase [Asaia siamensis]GBR06018.1 putative hydrolase [Asaia siamensis NRIC 0323]GGC35357.1 alpha/beta hydrolase [Asaia siamensis]